MTTTLIRGGTVITPTGERVADLVIENDTIVQAEGFWRHGADRIIDAEGCIVSPGFVQTHVHLCQSAFSGLAEDLDVMTWLDQWIWPLEQRLDAATLSSSARLGVAEMLLTGTTSFLSMETARYTDSAFEAAADLGARATIGKAIMDREEPGTALLGESTAEAWSDLLRLVHTWHGRDGGRIRASVSPRSPSAATPQMWADSLELATRTDLIVHTHVNENRGQSENVAGVNGGRDIHYLNRVGALTRRSVLAHCVWLDDDEVALLTETATSVAHCPSANLKLGSGIADVPRLLAKGVNVGLGIDGAACNNTHDARQEMRLAALLHRYRGNPAAVTSSDAFAMATRNGAKALGYGGLIGSIQPGMKADIAVFDAPQFFEGTAERAQDHLVYSGAALRARTVLVGGRVVVDDFDLVYGNTREIRHEAAQVRRTLERDVTA